MPYYIQLLFQEIDDYCSEHEIENPSNQDIDRAYNNLFEQHNRKNFSHWNERLSKFKKIEQQFNLCLERFWQRFARMGRRIDKVTTKIFLPADAFSTPLTSGPIEDS